MDVRNKDSEIIWTDIKEKLRLTNDPEEALATIKSLKGEGLKIVYTMGVYDAYHIGHTRYLEKAKACGDILVVGIDSDAFTKERKGPSRPLVPYDERWEMLARDWSVNIVFVINSNEQSVELLQAIKPDVVVLSFSSTKDIEGYPERMQAKYGPYCRRIEILPRQAETSTSARISQVKIDGAKDLVSKVEAVCAELKETVENFFTAAREGV